MNQSQTAAALGETDRKESYYESISGWQVGRSRGLETRFEVQKCESKLL